MPRQYTPKIKRTCEQCGATFYRRPCDVRRTGARFCSVKCSNLNSSLKHGGAVRGDQLPEYKVWAGMRTRCTNPNFRSYENYGGRGITICPEWDDFSRFLADMGRRPTPAHTLERCDNDLGYSTDNCRWATHAEQMSNMRLNRNLEYQGRTQTVAQWAREIGMNVHTLYTRLDKGWSVEDALTAPVGRWASRKKKLC